MPKQWTEVLRGLALILYFALPQGARASTPPDKWLPRCGGTYGLCGFVERGGGKVAIPFRFEVAQPFSEELAAVRVDGKFGYVDREGKMVIPSRFAAAGDFIGGYAEVRLGGASGVINRSGAIVIPARFARVLPFSGAVFIAQPLGREYSNHDLRLASDLRTDITLHPEATSGLYHARKGWLTAQDFSFSFFDNPERGLVWASKPGENGAQVWGLMKVDGTWQVEPRFSHVQWLIQGQAIVRGDPSQASNGSPTASDDPWGAVDANGRLAVPLRFTYLSYWRGGYGLTTEGKPNYDVGRGAKPRRGIVQPDGQLLGGRFFDDVDVSEDGAFPRARLGDQWYSVERDGRLVPDQANGSVLLRCPGGLVLLRRGDNVEFRHHRRTAPIGLFDYTYQSQRDCSNTMSVRSKGLWSFVTQDGRHLGGSGFEDVYGFAGGYAPVAVKGKWGIIDDKGELTVKPTYQKIQAERGAYLAQGLMGEEWIDGRGRKIGTPPIAKPDPRRLLLCQGELVLFDRDGMWGMRDASGKVVIQPKYRALSCFANGVAWVPDQGRKAWCAVGPDGVDRASLECKTTYYPVTITEHYPEPFANDPFESSVLWNRAYLDYASGRRQEPPSWIWRFGPRK